MNDNNNNNKKSFTFANINNILDDFNSILWYMHFITSVFKVYDSMLRLQNIIKQEQEPYQ